MSGRHAVLWRQVAPIALSLVLPALAAAGPNGEPAWRQASFDAGHTWFNRDETLLDAGNVATLAPLWTVTLGQFYVGPTAQAFGGIAVCSNLYGLSVLNAKNGRMLWSNAELPGANCASPALRGTTIYVTTSESSPPSGHLSAIDGRTGALLWSVPSADGLSLGFENPTLAGSTLYVADRRYAVYAFSAADGTQLWRAETPWLQNAATVAGGKVVVTTWNACCTSEARRLYAFDAASGAEAWNVPVDTSNMQYPALITGGRAYTGSDSGYVRSFDLATGAKQWETLLSGYVSAPPAAAGATLLVSSANRTLSAIDADTGAVTWTQSIAPASIASNMAIANGVVYLTVNDPLSHRLAAFDAATGAKLALPNVGTLSGSFAKLSVVDGRVHVATSYGWLHVFALAR